MRKTSPGRRRFLKSAAVTGAALVGGATAEGCAAERAARASGSGHGADAGARSRSGRRRGAHDRPAGRRLHGGRLQDARPRIRRGQSGVELPRPARIDRQLRRQPGAGIHHVLPRGVVGGDGPRLLQGRRQADGRARARDRRPAARGDGDLQRVLRSRAASTSSPAIPSTPRSGGPASSGPQRAGRGGDGPRFHQVGRPAGLAPALRRVGRARVQDRDDAADDARAPRRRRRAAGRSGLASTRRCAFRS